MLREFLLTAFSSCKAIIFLNYNMIYKSQLSFILLMGTDSKWNAFSQNIKLFQELTEQGIKRNIFCNQAYQSVGLCWPICWWMLVFRVLGSAWLSSSLYTFLGWHQPLQKLQLLLLPQWLPTPHISPELQVPMSNHPLNGPQSCLIAQSQILSFPHTVAMSFCYLTKTFELQII